MLALYKIAYRSLFTVCKQQRGLQMVNQLTSKQIDWAKQHDWFCFIDSDCSCIVVNDCYSDHTGYHEKKMIWNGSFSDLRRWAGY